MVKQYRSAMGKVVDFERLRQANEGTIAVTGGSQNVNARGDELGDNGQIVRTREEVLSAYNKRRNLNAVPDVQPDAIQIIPPTPTNIGDPFDPVADAARSDAFAVMDDEFGPMISVTEQNEARAMEQKRQEEMLKRTTEMREKRAAQVALEGAVEYSYDGDRKVFKVDVGELSSDEAVVAINEVKKEIHDRKLGAFIDDVTGKEYKTAASLKTAITKRENATSNSDASWAE